MQEEDGVLSCRVSVEGAKTLLVDDRRSDQDDDDDDGRLWQNCRQARLAMDSSLWVMIMMLYCLYCYWFSTVVVENDSSRRTWRRERE